MYTYLVVWTNQFIKLLVGSVYIIWTHLKVKKINNNKFLWYYNTQFKVLMYYVTMRM